MRAGRMRSRVQLYAEADVPGPLASRTEGWAPAGRWWARLLSTAATVKHLGAGESTDGVSEMEFRTSAPVVERMGVEGVSGPGAGQRWRITSVDDAMPDRKLVKLEKYTGSFG